ncbi:MAG: hypothetical protein ACRDBG_28470, partial [Waterburya sp.]
LEQFQAKIQLQKQQEALEKKNAERELQLRIELQKQIQDEINRKIGWDGSGYRNGREYLESFLDHERYGRFKADEDDANLLNFGANMGLQRSRSIFGRG